MLNIRLSRVGKRNHAQYKLVVAEKTAPIKGKFVEQLGSYDPHTKELIVKNERVKYWISQGAGCSTTVHNLLVKKGVIEGEKIKLTFKSKKSEEGEGEKSDNEKQSEDKGKKAEKSEKTEEEKAGTASLSDDTKEESAKKEEKTEEK